MSSDEQNPVRARNEAVVHRFVEAMNRGDWEREFADCRDDFKLIVMCSDGPHESTLAEAKHYDGGLSAPAFEGRILRVKLHQLFHADDNHVITWLTSHGRFKTGVEYRNTYVQIWNILEEKVVSLTLYVDNDAAVLYRGEVEKYWKMQDSVPARVG
jgi:ketosteroid isomerase-like protein